MKKLLFVSLFIAVSGCAGNEFTHINKFPNKASGNEKDAAIYSAIAIAAGKLKEECSHGHIEDRKKCREKKKNQ